MNWCSWSDLPDLPGQRGKYQADGDEELASLSTLHHAPTVPSSAPLQCASESWNASPSPPGRCLRSLTDCTLAPSWYWNDLQICIMQMHIAYYFLTAFTNDMKNASPPLTLMWLYLNIHMFIAIFNVGKSSFLNWIDNPHVLNLVVQLEYVSVFPKQHFITKLYRTIVN